MNDHATVPMHLWVPPQQRLEEERHSLFNALELSGNTLCRACAVLTPEAARTPRTAGGVSPQAYLRALAAFERQGFGDHIDRILVEDTPTLETPTVAALLQPERPVLGSMADTIAAFRYARSNNLSVLRLMSAKVFSRCGIEPGIGRLSLLDLVRRMLDHDLAQREIMVALLTARAH